LEELLNQSVSRLESKQIKDHEQASSSISQLQKITDINEIFKETIKEQIKQAKANNELPPKDMFPFKDFPGLIRFLY
jgi:hypothetical protein